MFIMNSGNCFVVGILVSMSFSSLPKEPWRLSSWV
jgi:hypothetical protein